MYDGSPEELEKFARDYFRRFWRVRQIESDNLPDGLFRYSAGASALLSELEGCYAAKCYYACIVIAASIVESHLRDVDEINKKRLDDLLERAGLRNEYDWLREFRNGIVHGKPHEDISTCMTSELQEKLDAICLRAIRLAHSMPMRSEQKK